MNIINLQLEEAVNVITDKSVSKVKCTLIYEKNNW